jgi:plasmid stability protein
MAQLIVRDIEEHVVQALKERAVRSGRSAEAEHREILRQALRPGRTEDPKAVLLAMPAVGKDSDFARATDLGRVIDL